METEMIKTVKEFSDKLKDVELKDGEAVMAASIGKNSEFLSLAIEGKGDDLGDALVNVMIKHEDVAELFIAVVESYEQYQRKENIKNNININ